jgi:HAMP domain-containing protein
MAKPTLPKMPDRSPSALVKPALPPSPSLSPSQSDAFNRAHARVERCLDELKRLDQQLDGGDPVRKQALRDELEELTQTLAQITRLMTAKLDVATEAEVASMNRAQRRIFEATLRKNKKKAKAKARSSGGAAR